MSASQYQDPPRSADAALMAAYHEWRQWTEAEGEAIRASNWARVAECQGAKQQLQPRLVQLGGAARFEWSLQGAVGRRQEQAMREMVGVLIRLETQNGEQLARKRETVMARQAELVQSRSNLRRVRRSYAPTRGAAWSSFS